MAVVTLNMSCPPHTHANPYRCAPTLSSLRIPHRPATLALSTAGGRSASRMPHVNQNPYTTPLSPCASISEIIDRLYVSDFSSAEDPSLLAAHGITHILSAMPLVRTPAAYRSRAHMIVPLQDTPFAELADHLAATTKFIQQALHSNPHARVLVHCQMGASRSVSVVAGYLIASFGMSPTEAVAHVKARRAVAAPNWGFLMQLEEYSTTLDADAIGSPCEDHRA